MRILRKQLILSEKYATDYMQISLDRSHRNILIAYVSAYGYTKRAAEIIAEGILENEDNISVDIADIENIEAR